MADTKEQSFEASMKRLNTIVEDLETGELTLDESLKLYEEGVRLSQDCMKRLTDAQQKIEMLMRSSGDTEELDPESLKPKVTKSPPRPPKAGPPQADKRGPNH